MLESLVSGEDYSLFCTQVQDQSLRALKRFQGYGDWVKQGDGAGEFYDLLGKILLDDRVYDLEERALAFEIVACEALAVQWPLLDGTLEEIVVLGGDLGRVALYRQLLNRDNGLDQRLAYAQVLGQKFKRHVQWIAARAQQPGPQDPSQHPLVQRFMGLLDQVAPLPLGANPPASDPEAADGSQQTEEEIAALKDDLEFAEDRANRAHARIKKQEEEVQQLRRQIREERENGEKLRQERSRRIKLDRHTANAEREIESLRREYFKMERRLQVMAQRLAASEQQRQGGELPGARELAALKRLEPAFILGLDGDEDIGQIRRRFAAVFHPDRVQQMPVWVKRLFADILVVINEACDRKTAENTPTKHEGEPPA